MKRIIAVILTISLLCSLFSVPAYAATDQAELSITPSQTTMVSPKTDTEVVYTVNVKLLDTSEKIGSAGFTLVAPSAITFTTDPSKWQVAEVTESVFSNAYKPDTKVYTLVYMDSTDKTDIDLLKISATIAAGTTGSQKVTLSNYAVSDAVGNELKLKVIENEINFVSALTGKLPVDITAPVKGAVPQSTISATTQYTGTIAWEGNPTTFAANTAYTATVTLTAKPGYQFANGVNPTVAGSTSVTGVNVKDSGSKLEFKATFPRTADKDTPVITTLPTAGSINYDQMLYKSSLSGGEAKVGSIVVPGSFKWKEERLKPEVKDSNATEYEVVFKPNDTTSYETTTCKVKLTVNKKTLTNLATTPISDQLYTGSPITPTFNVMNGKNFDEILDPSDYKVIFTNNTNVGTANYTIKETPTGNYKFNTSYGTFEIKKADSTISIIGDPSKTYDGKVVNDPAVNKSGSTGAVTYTYYTNEDCTTKTTAANSGAASDGAAPKNAGDYWVVAAVAASANYNAATSAAKKFTISQKDLTDDMITLGTQKTYNGTEQSVQIASVKDGTASLIATIDYTIESGNKAADVGNNTLVIKGKGNYTGEASATWSLVAKDVTITRLTPP